MQKEKMAAHPIAVASITPVSLSLPPRLTVSWGLQQPIRRQHTEGEGGACLLPECFASAADWVTDTHTHTHTHTHSAV
ncbi:Protein translocase subunit SecA [Dissostichus eleginoides]|uniref:Protein translocase subunit SecA n=1 Tax=Dissostichus eleginoides TaxID=100907 RepID=A0AAD9BLF1_DISEL|nr:Protein translocase subunit SecA [Dissostichus eleginoides]